MREHMEALEMLRERYVSYLQEVEKLEMDRKFGEGIFGLKGGPGDDPCHDRFAESLHAFYENYAAQKPDSASVRELMEYTCTAPLAHTKLRTAYWMLLAVQGLTQPLIRLLSPEDAGILADLYEKNYRRFERLPVQNQVIKALKAAARQ